MRRSTLLLSLALVLALCLNAFSFTAGFGLGWARRGVAESRATAEHPPTLSLVTPAPKPDATTMESFLDDERLGLISEAWGFIDRDFFTEEPVDYTRVNYEMIRGLVGALDDPYTRFVEPPQAELEKSDYEGKFGGIGAYIGMTEQGQPYISEVMRGNPAEAAGLRAGDIILEVDGASLEGLGQDDVVLLIRGPVGTQVMLTIQRGPEADILHVPVERAEIKLPTVFWEPVDDGRVAHIRLTFFAAPTGQELAAVLQEVRDAGISKLVLDMRNNRGGLLSAAGDVTAQFVEPGVLLYERHRGENGEVREEAYMIPGAQQVLSGADMVVLVNGGTASASEIVAGALQDYGRATLIGEMTFGKGCMQYVHELSDKSSLRVTAANWLTPNRRPISGVGLVPDIEVTRSQQDAEAERDPQLERAISHLGERS